jgi:hypothetical protein
MSEPKPIPQPPAAQARTVALGALLTTLAASVQAQRRTVAANLGDALMRRLA